MTTSLPFPGKMSPPPPFSPLMKSLRLAFALLLPFGLLSAATAAEKPSGATPEPANGSKPNILWIFIEDMSAWIDCYGSEVNKGKTPTIDRLASQGVRFTRCYVPCPVCSPCRSAMITGAYQTTTGIHNHRSSRSEEGAIHLPEGVTTVPEIFRRHGYDTFNAGKDDYNFVYDRATLYSVPKVKRTAFDAWRQLPKGKPWFGQIQLRGGKSNPSKWKDKVDPDTVTPPPYFPNNELFRKWHAHHYDTVRQTDADTKVILENLKKDGLLENTIIFWFTDHGNNHSVRAKQFCTEIGTHVPLIVLGPDDRLTPGTVRTGLTSTLDISATSLAMAGIEIPAYFDGAGSLREGLPQTRLRHLCPRPLRLHHRLHPHRAHREIPLHPQLPHRPPAPPAAVPRQPRLRAVPAQGTPGGHPPQAHRGDLLRSAPGRGALRPREGSSRDQQPRH